MKTAWTEKGVGDEEVKRMNSRFILKLIGLVEVWCGSKHGDIKDDLEVLSVNFVCSSWKISLQHAILLSYQTDD